MNLLDAAPIPDVCEVTCVNEERVERVRSAMRSDATMVALAETFRALGDPTRARIMFALSRDELCVCDLAFLLGASVSAVSHQLRVLRNLKLVKHRKEGKMVYYSLDDGHIHELFAQGLEHVEEDRS
jgi:ArsR family transcriptional regulator, lead/cadmium/zinc/bismuth-responsive transcriptional repressor